MYFIGVSLQSVSLCVCLTWGKGALYSEICVLPSSTLYLVHVRGFCMVANSVLAYASVNHLHYHFLYLEHPLLAGTLVSASPYWCALATQVHVRQLIVLLCD